jgi:sRNA-binding carbon storage regulator CsrA
LSIAESLYGHIEHKDVWVTGLRSNGNQVRLGVDAPSELKVRRAEIAPPAGIQR